MTTTPPTPAAELPYDAYQQRQLRETTGDQLRYRAAQLRTSGRFGYENGAWRGLSYEGYAVVSVVDTNPGNDGLSDRLQAMQQRIADGFDNPSTCFLLPPASFHQTVANTLSDDRYREHVVAAGLTDRFPSLIRSAFEQLPTATETEPIRMRLVGLSLFSGAVGMLGVFENEADFSRILAFREDFYANPALAKLTIRRTRPFIGHITLAYLEAELSEAEKDRLVTTCETINQTLADEPLYFTISTTELRSYPHLADFQAKDGYPAYQFTVRSL